MSYRFIIISIGIAVIFVSFYFYNQYRQFSLPKGETRIVETPSLNDIDMPVQKQAEDFILVPAKSDRTILVTDGVKHSVLLDEILSGGPSKDGIPSIDDPKFISIKEANEWLQDDEAGQGLCINNDCRFYPYLILVWHEIVNDTVGGYPALVTYCPLCLTGIVFERKLEGKTVEFGTSGKLWKSNLVMYNRTADSKDESLWSQVLGEAILGKFTGTKLNIISSDVVKYGDWKKIHPNTKVLSKDTGISRSYGYDPYGDYYTSNSVSFGASFDDSRLHPKEYVLGINIKGKYKAYHSDALKVGQTKDRFNGVDLILEKNSGGEVRMFYGSDKTPLPYIGGFWFSWLAVHPNTDLYK